ncbi:hypothetical protein D3C71_1863300 [compost metagenome]
MAIGNVLEKYLNESCTVVGIRVMCRASSRQHFLKIQLDLFIKHRIQRSDLPNVGVVNGNAIANRNVAISMTRDYRSDSTKACQMARRCAALMGVMNRALDQFLRAECSQSCCGILHS